MKELQLNNAHQYILGLDISVYHALLVQILQGFSHVQGNQQSLLEWGKCWQSFLKVPLHSFGHQQHMVVSRASSILYDTAHQRQNVGMLKCPARRTINCFQYLELLERAVLVPDLVLKRDPRYKRTVGQVEMSLICHQQRTRQELVIRWP